MKRLTLIFCAICLSSFPVVHAQNLQESCDMNNVEACMQLGMANQTSDKVVAYNAFVKACSLGSGEACYRAAFVLNWNFGPNHICPSKARKYLRQGCKLNFKPACKAVENIWAWDPYTPIP